MSGRGWLEDDDAPAPRHLACCFPLNDVHPFISTGRRRRLPTGRAAERAAETAGGGEGDGKGEELGIYEWGIDAERAM